MDRRENFLQHRDEEHQQRRQDERRQHKQNARINHRRENFRFQFLLAGLKLGNLRQHHVKESAGLARLHHRDINARKSLR